MADIDVGGVSEDKNGQSNFNYTYLTNINTADGDGTIDEIDVWMIAGGANTDFGTFTPEGSNVFSVNGTTGSLTTSNGSQTLSSPGNFSAFNVSTGDVAGIYCPSGVRIEQDTYGSPTGSGIKREYGNHMSASSRDFDADFSTYDCPLYFRGETAGGGGLSIPVARHHYSKNLRV